MNSHQKSPIGIFYIMLGLIIFIIAAGELLIRLLFGLLGAWIVNYGFQVVYGRPLIMSFWSYRNDTHFKE